MAVQRPSHSRQGSRDSSSKKPNDRPPSLVYDPKKERLSIEKIPADRLDSKSQIQILSNYSKFTSLGYTTCECPGRNNPVEIFIGIGEGQSRTQSLIARVDLSKLGWTKRYHRGCKEEYTQKILVKGKVPQPNTCEKGMTWPRDKAKSDSYLPPYEVPSCSSGPKH